VTRIVAGAAGGRRLRVPRGGGTRPTAERTREGLFSTLVSIHGALDGLGFLDLYAGSGAVGLEAASRGARPVLLVERDSDAIAVLRGNLAALDLDGVTLRGEPVERVLRTEPAAAYDVAFLDPPYALAVGPVLDLLVAGGWLAQGATVAVERATRDEPFTWPAGLEPLRSRRYGDSTLWYGRRP
jgi:16S rRNA (guanine966-N2)-methyltransferase